MQYLIAPILLIAALIFVYVYQDNRAAHDTQRAKHDVEMQKFNSDFQAAWNGEKLEKLEVDDLRKARERLALSQKKADAQQIDTKNKLDDLGTRLDAELNGRNAQNPNIKINSNPFYNHDGDSK